jgi:hypothetical protein
MGDWGGAREATPLRKDEMQATWGAALHEGYCLMDEKVVADGWGCKRQMEGEVGRIKQERRRI